MPDTTAIIAIAVAATAYLGVIGYAFLRTYPTTTMNHDDLWPLGWPHEAPEMPFTVEQAHRVWQQHMNHDCPRLNAALEVLRASGKLVPDYRAAR